MLMYISKFRTVLIKLLNALIEIVLCYKIKTTFYHAVKS